MRCDRSTFPFESWHSGFDVDVADPPIFDMPVEARLKFMAIVGSNGMNAKGEFFNEKIDEFDHCRLIMLAKDFYSTNTRGIIDSCILKSSDFLTFFVLQT